MRSRNKIRCGYSISSGVSCEIPTPINKSGSKDFEAPKGKYIYVGGYEILVSRNADIDGKHTGEGLLYMPLLRMRLAVEWQSATIAKGDDAGTHGCLYPEARAIGNVNGVTGADYKKQIIDLLTSGPHKSGSLEEMFEEVSASASKLLATPTPTESDKHYENIKYAGDAIKKGFDEWKNQVKAIFGNDLTQDVSPDFASVLLELESTLNEGATCSASKSCSTSQLQKLEAAKTSFQRLLDEVKKIQENGIYEDSGSIPIPAQASSSNISSSGPANKTSTSTSANRFRVTNVPLNNGSVVQLKPGVVVEYDATLNEYFYQTTAGFKPIKIMVKKSTGSFSTFYLKDYTTEGHTLPCTKSQVITKLWITQDKAIDACDEGVVDDIFEPVLFNNTINIVGNTEVSLEDRKLLSQLFNGSKCTNPNNCLKAKVFLTFEGITPQDSIQAVCNAKVPAGFSKIWLHKTGKNWTFRNECGSNQGGHFAIATSWLDGVRQSLDDISSECKKYPPEALTNQGMLDALNKETLSTDQMLIGIAKFFEETGKAVDSKLKLDEKTWNCNDPNYKEVYKTVYEFMTWPLYPVRELIKQNFGYKDIAKAEFSVLCGAYDGVMGVFGSLPAAIGGMASLFTCQGGIGSKIGAMADMMNYKNPNDTNRTGVTGAITDAIAGMFLDTNNNLKTCVVGHTVGEFGVGIAMAFINPAKLTMIGAPISTFVKIVNRVEDITEKFDLMSKLGGRIWKGLPMGILGKIELKGYLDKGILKWKKINVANLPSKKLRGTDGADYNVHYDGSKPAPNQADVDVKPLLDDKGNPITDDDGNPSTTDNCLVCVSKKPKSSGFFKTQEDNNIFAPQQPIYASLGQQSFVNPLKNYTFALPLATPATGCDGELHPAQRLNTGLLDRLKDKLTKAPYLFSAEELEKFLADFDDTNLRARFLDEADPDFPGGTSLDPAVWKKFASLTGPSKEWIRKSVALQERIKAKIADGTITTADVDKLKDYYSRHRSNKDVTTYPKTSNTGQYYEALGHPDFTKAVKEIRKKDGTLGRPVYEPPAGITGDRATDARLANEEMARRFNAEDFEYTQGSNVCKIKDTITGEMIPHTWHHHQDGKTMMAVPESIHDTFNATHIGGVQVKNAGIIGFFESPIF